MASCTESGATQSPLPLKIKVGLKSRNAATDAGGVVSAAEKLAPPHIECPATAALLIMRWYKNEAAESFKDVTLVAKKDRSSPKSRCEGTKPASVAGKATT